MTGTDVLALVIVAVLLYAGSALAAGTLWYMFLLVTRPWRWLFRRAAHH